MRRLVGSIMATALFVVVITTNSTRTDAAPALSEGCMTINAAEAEGLRGVYGQGGSSYTAGERIVFTATEPAPDTPDSLRIVKNGTEVAHTSFPGALTYTIPASGVITQINFEVVPQGDQAIIHLTCTAAPAHATATPKPTNTPKPTSTPKPTNPPKPTAMPRPTATPR